ncbi:MAG: HEAT repeat domain-containing protein [Gemmatimonadota bacterium]|nr:MAG: HEAT repeat domain-containing protein [Gemmatimonadota bacterium]
MTCENIQERIIDYVLGAVEAAEKRTVKDHLAECETCRLQLERMEIVWRGLNRLPESEPSPALRSRFYAMLESEKHREPHKIPLSGRIEGFIASLWPKRPALQLAYALVLLIVGLFIGGRVQVWEHGNGEMAALRQEISEMRQMVSVSLMNQTSSGERLRGIQYTEQIKHPTGPLLQVLLGTLNSDPNVNVRLAAVDALFAFSDRPGIREALIASLSQQTSPLVQISLIDLLVEIRERRSLEALRDLIGNQQVDPTVKEYAEKRINELI